VLIETGRGSLTLTDHEADEVMAALMARSGQPAVTTASHPRTKEIHLGGDVAPEQNP
jgi:hypothetical protein